MLLQHNRKGYKVCHSITVGPISSLYIISLPWEIFHAFVLSADFFHNPPFQRKVLSGIPSECQID